MAGLNDAISAELKRISFRFKKNDTQKHMKKSASRTIKLYLDSEGIASSLPQLGGSNRGSPFENTTAFHAIDSVFFHVFKVFGAGTRSFSKQRHSGFEIKQ